MWVTFPGKVSSEKQELSKEAKEMLSDVRERSQESRSQNTGGKCFKTGSFAGVQCAERQRQMRVKSMD